MTIDRLTQIISPSLVASSTSGSALRVTRRHSHFHAALNFRNDASRQASVLHLRFPGQLSFRESRAKQCGSAPPNNTLSTTAKVSRSRHFPTLAYFFFAPPARRAYCYPSLAIVTRFPAIMKAFPAAALSLLLSLVDGQEVSYRRSCVAFGCQRNGTDCLRQIPTRHEMSPTRSRSSA